MNTENAVEIKPIRARKPVSVTTKKTTKKQVVKTPQPPVAVDDFEDVLMEIDELLTLGESDIGIDDGDLSDIFDDLDFEEILPEESSHDDGDILMAISAVEAQDTLQVTLSEAYLSQEIRPEDLFDVEAAMPGLSSQEVKSVDVFEEVAVEAPQIVVVATKTVNHKSRVKKPSVRVAETLGSSAAHFERLSLTDPKTDQQVVDEFSEIVDSLALYVGDKAVNLIETLHRGGGLSAVTERGFKVLIRDGKLTSGKDGNITKNLLSKPYSPETAASQGNQLMKLFVALKIAMPLSRGVIVENSDSAILEKIKAIIA